MMPRTVFPHAKILQNGTVKFPLKYYFVIPSRTSYRMFQVTGGETKSPTFNHQLMWDVQF